MVNIEIDGISLKARDGAMIIEAADEAGVTIPRFCYHKKLSIAANCRMCLVEVEKAAKPLPACATPVTEGMKISTRSSRALDAQRGTMEFLLINHPLDCPICDQGGECELQDVAMGYGGDHTRFGEGKRAVQDKNLGPLISTDMTRCIHCTRCVRFGEEVAGIKELGATGRGEHMSIGTYVERAVTSEMSGNVIDLCPVGALTSKPFRYSARPWELTSRTTIAPHDCIGSNIYVHLRRNQVMRALPRENEQINETWLSDRDRFSYEGLNSGDRLRRPMTKDKGAWQETDWNTAFEAAVKKLKAVLNGTGPDGVGVLVSPSATLEEMYLAQKLARGLGIANIDHRLRQQDFSDQASFPVYPGLGMAIEDLERLDSVLLIGSNIRTGQPIAAHRLRKAFLQGGRIMAVNPVDYEFRFGLAGRIICHPGDMPSALAGIARSLIDSSGAPVSAELNALLAGVQVNEQHRNIASQLGQGERSAVLLGDEAYAHPQASVLRALAGVIAEHSRATLGMLTPGANSAGAWLAGAVPHRGPAGKDAVRKGLNAQTMLEAGLKAYIVIGNEPELDCADSGAALTAMNSAECVVVMTPYVSETMKQYAHVLLPIAPFTETSGTYVNAEGRWQSFAGAVQPLGETRPGWKVLRVMGNLFNIDGFEYVSSEEVRDELNRAAKDIKAADRVNWIMPRQLASETKSTVRLADVPIYAADGLVRRAKSLQQTGGAETAAVRINSALAAQLNVKDGDAVMAGQAGNEVIMPVKIDNAVAHGCVLMHAGTAGSAGMGAYGAPIQLQKA